MAAMRMAPLKPSQLLPDGWDKGVTFVPSRLRRPALRVSLLLLGTCGSVRRAAAFGLGVRPAGSLQQHERASCSANRMRMSEDTTEFDGAVGRGPFLRNSAVLLAGAGLAGPSRPDSANAIGELVEFRDQERFAQHATVQVPDMAAALKFYVDGVGMKVLRTRAGPQFNTTVVGFGPEALQVPPSFVFGVSSMRNYGGHFTVELNSQEEVVGGEEIGLFFDPGNGVQYLQMAVDNYRISTIIKAGGIIEYGYGYLLVLAPGGLRLAILMGDRRDPPMFVAVKVKDLKKSVQWYTDVAGMSKFPYPLARAPGSPFEPLQPKDSVFMAYEGDAFGVLLVPAARGETVNPGGVFSASFLAEDVGKIAEDVGGTVDADSAWGATRSVSVSDPDGYAVKFVEYSSWQKGLPPLL